MVRQLILKDLSKIEDGVEKAVQLPQNIKKACQLREAEYDSDVLQKITELEQ